MSHHSEKGSIIDVRTPEEFKEGHYPGAVNIPVDQVQGRIDEFKEMEKPIVMYCRSGNRSGMATSILKQNGIDEVTNGGGLDDMMAKRGK